MLCREADIMTYEPTAPAAVLTYRTLLCGLKSSSHGRLQELEEEIHTCFAFSSANIFQPVHAEPPKDSAAVRQINRWKLSQVSPANPRTPR